MGYDTKSRVQKMTIDASGTPSDIWVGTDLVKELYSDTTRVYNAKVYAMFATNSQFDYLYSNQLKYTVKLDGKTTNSGTITSSNWETATYKNPSGVNGQMLYGYGLDVGYGASVTYEISGVANGFGAFALNSKTKTVQYTGSNVSKASNAYFYSNIDAIDWWGIRPVSTKSFTGIKPFNSSGNLNSSNFNESGQVYMQWRFWEDEYSENATSEVTLYAGETLEEGEFYVFRGSKGYLSMSIYGLKVGNIGAGKDIPYKVYAWSKPYSGGAYGTSTSRTPDNGASFTVYLGQDVSYGSWSASDFSSSIDNIYVDDSGNVYVDVDLDVGYYATGSYEAWGEGAALYFGSACGAKSAAIINTFLSNIKVDVDICYG